MGAHKRSKRHPRNMVILRIRKKGKERALLIKRIPCQIVIAMAIKVIIKAVWTAV